MGKVCVFLRATGQHFVSAMGISDDRFTGQCLRCAHTHATANDTCRVRANVAAPVWDHVGAIWRMTTIVCVVLLWSFGPERVCACAKLQHDTWTIAICIVAKVFARAAQTVIALSFGAEEVV